MPSLGGLAGAVYQYGNTMRQNYLLDLQNRKQMQDRDLDTLQNWATNPAFTPETQAEAQQALIEMQGMPLDKFKPEKATKTITGIIENHRNREQQAIQQAQQNQFQVPPMPPAPQMGGEAPPMTGGLEGLPNVGMPNPSIMPPGATITAPQTMHPFFNPELAAQVQAHLASITGAPAIQAKIHEEQAKQQAELEGKLALEKYKRDRRQEVIDQFKKSGVNHYFEAIGASGEPELRPDRGNMIAGIIPGNELAGETDPKTGKQLDPAKFYRVREYPSDGSREYFVQTDIREMRQITDPATGRSFLVGFDRNGKPIPGTEKETVNAALLPTTNSTTTTREQPVTQANGQIVAMPFTTGTSTTRQRTLPGAPQAVPMPQAPGGAPTTPYVGPGLSTSAPAAPKAPKAAVPSGGRIVGAKFDPEALTARGQTDMAALDPVLKQIQDIKKRLEDEKLHENDSSMTLAPDYIKYRLGRSTPHNDLFTNLSFEQLRSAAAAMKGMNSRAYPIIERALQHTPTLDRAGGLLADTPKTMYDKLDTMEKILKDGKQAILNDERKSGVLRAAPMPGRVKVQIPGQEPGEIDADQLEAFKKKYPDGKVF